MNLLGLRSDRAGTFSDLKRVISSSRRTQRPAKKRSFSQPNEIRVLFNDACFPRYGRQEEAHYINAWRFLVATGLRRGEMCGLRTEDINGRILTVQRSINSANEITEGKNKNARRTIELTDTALNVLEDQRKMLQRKGLVSPWVFCDQYGERPSPNCVYDQWDTYRKHHGIRSNLHELRHTFISVNKSDLPLELMKSVVGHSQSMGQPTVFMGTRSRASDTARRRSLTACFAEF